MDAGRMRRRRETPLRLGQRHPGERGHGGLSVLGTNPPPIGGLRDLLPEVRAAPDPEGRGEVGMAIDRRTFLQLGALGLSGAALRGGLAQDAGKTPTRFQVGCTTLPYAPFSLDRALQGIRSAGFKYVALYTTHKEDGKAVPVIAPDDPVEKAKEVGRRCRDQGLEPAFMFSGIYPEAKDGLEVLTRRLQQASAANIAQVLTFGHTKGGNRALWVERFRKLGPIARDLGVLLVVKQHGG